MDSDDSDSGDNSDDDTDDGIFSVHFTCSIPLILQFELWIEVVLLDVRSVLIDGSCPLALYL